MELEQIGSYRIVRQIGQGATAKVYLAEGPDHPEPVAIKHVLFEEKDGAQWTRRLKKLFSAEAALSGRLNHPNIIKIHDAIVEEHQAYLVMEYVDGKQLSEFCAFDKLLPLHRVVSIIFKCCMALDYASKLGIVHRDIKPANILIDAKDNVKITDFGLALNISRKEEHDTTFITGVGSPAYMSPEQIKSYPLNAKTDLYSLGIVLFHLLTGRLPFRGANSAQLIYRIINTDPPQPSLLNPNIPVEMDAIIQKALEKDLYSRYKSGAEFGQDLSSVRYQILDDKKIPLDRSRLDKLQKVRFFKPFEEFELWEVLRISTWRELPAGAMIIKEGDTDRNFGIIVEGEVEVSRNGKLIVRLVAGEPVGELAYLNELYPERSASVVCVNDVVYLEINSAAMALATEEVRDRFHRYLMLAVSRRLIDANNRLAEIGPSVQVRVPARQHSEWTLDPLESAKK